MPCAFTRDDLKSDFIGQAALNGSGRRMDDRSYVQLESECFKLAKTVPDDALRWGEDPTLPEAKTPETGQAVALFLYPVIARLVDLAPGTCGVAETIRRRDRQPRQSCGAGAT